MRVAILGDAHIGMRNDALHFYDYYNRFYQEIFFPYLKKHGIKRVVQTGDLFDRRKFINFHILHKAYTDFFDWFDANDVIFETYIGNHDTYYRNTISVNSPQLLLSRYKSFRIHERPATVDFDGVPIDIIPWICQDNEQETMDFIKNSKSELCFGHFELTGFEMDKGNVCHTGMERSLLNKYELVLSGHFHHRSTDGHIFYVGSPGEMTFSDVDSIRGFHIFDTDTRLLEFVENPFRMFHRIKYDDKNEFTFDYMKTLDLTKYTGTYVKIIVVNKINPFLFETFVENLYKVSPIDITIVEDGALVSSATDEDLEKAEDTIEIMRKFIDGMELDVSKEVLYNKMHELWIEASNNASI